MAAGDGSSIISGSDSVSEKAASLPAMDWDRGSCAALLAGDVTLLVARDSATSTSIRLAISFSADAG